MYSVTRTIGIDAGHRVARHDSQCRNIHGHRYKIEVTCSCEQLISTGPETGMVRDFGLLKHTMMHVIHDDADHAMILDINDVPVLDMFVDIQSRGNVCNSVDKKGYFARSLDRSTVKPLGMKILVLPYTPTAENLAKFWFDRLQAIVDVDGAMQINKVVVWETPNCFASYVPT